MRFETGPGEQAQVDWGSLAYIGQDGRKRRVWAFVMVARKRPYAVRKPREYRAREPGDIVQVDTPDIRPLPGVVLKHFTARDVVSRWDVLQVHTRATSTLAAQFLDSMRQRFPFPIKAIQVDGGSEFQAGLESACQDHGIKSSYCRRAHPSSMVVWREVSEPIPLYDGEVEMVPLNRILLGWERVYDTIRPHHSLDGFTPAEYLEQYYPG